MLLVRARSIFRQEGPASATRRLREAARGITALLALLGPGLMATPTSAAAQETAADRGTAERRDTVVATNTAAAQDTASARDTIALPGIVVTATRVPLPREALPTPVTVWTGRELREQGVTTVAEALARTPAASVVRAGSPGAQTSLFLRGGESDYVKVLVDGVAVNDPGGAVDLADLTTDQVARIEVSRGPASVLYGSDAVSGVVQIFTRRGSGAPTLTAQVMGGSGRERGAPGRGAAGDVGAGSGGASGVGSGGASGAGPAAGSYGLVDAEATVAGATGDLAYTVGAAGSWSDGLYPVNSGRVLGTGTLRLAWTPATGTELAVSTRYTDSRSHFPTDGTGALTDANARLDRTLWTTSVVAGFRLHDRVDARIQAGLARRGQSTVDAPDGPADTLGTYASTLSWDLTRRSVDARVDVELPRSVLSAGVAWERADAATAYASESAFGPYTAGADYDRATRGYYLQLLSEPVRRVHLTLGGRLDDSDTYGAFETFRVGAAVEPLDGTRLRVAAGRGFREPAFDQVFGSGFGDLGNPSLEPERSGSWEVGVEQRLGAPDRSGPFSTTVSATWFDQRFDRLIQYTYVPPAEGAPNYFNVGAASARGLELEARTVYRRLGLDASYTYLETEVLDPGLATDAGFVEGDRLLRRPTHAGTVTGRLDLERGGIGLTVHVVGERDDLDFGAGFPAPRVALPAHATVDITAEHALPLRGPATTLMLRVRNALDATYQSIAGFPGTGRVVRLGVRVGL